MEAGEAIQFYIGVIRRRRYALILPSVLSFGLLVAVILKIPSVYRSSAAFVINNQFVPGNYSQNRQRTALTTLPTEERLQALKKIVLSRDNLTQLIRRFRIHDGPPPPKIPIRMVNRIRGRIDMKMVRTDIAVGQRNISAGGAYAFVLSFEDENPERVQAVTMAIADLFKRESYRFQKKRIEEAMAVLERQKVETEADILDKGREISAFKRRHQDALPQLFNTYISMLGELESEIERKEMRIVNIRDDERYWGGKLAITPMTLEVVNRAGAKVSSVKEEVKRMRQELAVARATLADDHPDVIELKKRLAAVEADASVRAEIGDIAAAISKRETELELIRKTHTDAHPDVIRLQKEIEGLRAELSALQRDKGVTVTEAEESQVNPQYVHIQNELITTQNELERQTSDLGILKAAYADYQDRLERIPQVELEYRSMENDYKNLKDLYNEAVDRLSMTREALKGIEGEWAENQFLLIDPPAVPEAPNRPNRKMLLAFAMAASGAVGLFCMIAREYTDRTVYATAQLVQLTGLPVLAGIPRLVTLQGRRVQRMARMAAVSLAGGVLVSLIFIHFYVLPVTDLIRGR